MPLTDELTALIRRVQANNPTPSDGAALVVLARLRDALHMGRELELAERCLRFSPTAPNALTIPTTLLERTAS